MNSRQEQLFRIGVEAQRNWLARGGQSGGPFRLENATISDMVLREAELSYAHLENIDFHDCDLSKATFDHATLMNVGFHRCKLPDASFRHITARNLELRETDARRAHFVDATVVGFNADMDTQIDRASFVRASLRYAHLIDVSATHANFARANLCSLDARQLDATEAFFHDTKLPEASFKRSRLVNATFDYATLTAAQIELCTVDGATFKDAEIEHLVLRSSPLDEKHSLYSHPEFARRTFRGLSPSDFKIGL